MFRTKVVEEIKTHFITWCFSDRASWIVYLQATRNSHREWQYTICCMCTTVSSWRWALGARNM